MVYEDLFTPGTELKELKFDNYLDWFIKISDVTVHWNYEPTYILSQASLLLGGLCTLIHAFSRGGRFLHLWLAILVHGFVVEAVSYVAPDIDNFWHSQTPIILLGRRLPFHIIILYQVFYYNASMAVAKAKLPRVAQACAVGLVSVLIDIVYDIVSVLPLYMMIQVGHFWGFEVLAGQLEKDWLPSNKKGYVHWFWHDTDPNVFDRHYWVPWTSYYFHATFSAGLIFWFHFLKDNFCQSEGQWISSKRCFRELFTTIVASFLGFPTGVLLFLPIYHPLHDNLKIHSEVTFFILFSIFLLIIWTADRKRKFVSTNIPHKTHWTTFILCFHLLVHYATFLSILIFFKPENEISTGIKERIGPCNEYSPVRTALGQVLQKRKYLCSTDYDEKYFDWKCLPNGKPPSNGSLWYTACGVPFSTHERAEYLTIISTFSLLAVVVFYNLHFKSFGDAVFTLKDRQIQDKLADQKKKKM